MGESQRQMLQYNDISHLADPDPEHSDIFDLEKRFRKNELMLDLVVSILESHYGGKLTVERLRIFARRFSKRINVRIDKLANRNRTALLCWYAEHWDIIYPHLDEYIPTQKLMNETINKSPEHREFDYIDPSDIQQLINYH